MHVGSLLKLGMSVLIITKCVAGLQSLGECILTTAKCVGGFQMFGESVLTTAMYVGCLLMLGVSFWITAICLQRLGECILYTTKRVGCLDIQTERKPAQGRGSASLFKLQEGLFNAFSCQVYLFSLPERLLETGRGLARLA